MLLLESTDLPVTDTSTAGPTLELDSVLLRILEPWAEPLVSERCAAPDLVRDYATLLTRPGKRRPEEVLTLADRIYAYPDGGTTKGIDQLGKVVAQLRKNPLSRRAIVQIWHPAADLSSDVTATPAGHCLIHFTIRETLLNMTVWSRSIDAWNGALPNFVAFSGLQEYVGKRLATPVGSYTHFVSSYHMYLRDIPAALDAFADRL